MKRINEVLISFENVLIYHVFKTKREEKIKTNLNCIPTCIFNLWTNQKNDTTNVRF